MELIRRYDAVFNHDGSRKCCGRQACMDLIEACSMFDNKKPSEYYGDLKTGMMNSENIKSLIAGIHRQEMTGES